MEDIQAQILDKQREMEVLQTQMQALNQRRLADLYPGRCFQYCIDQDLGTQDELAILSEAEVHTKAERAHFATVARKTRWPCGNEECEGWDTVSDTCPCGNKRFYWVYEEKLHLTNTTIGNSPASTVEQ